MEKLLTTLNALNISLELRDGNLDLYDPSEQLTEELLASIKEHKPQLVALLEGIDGEQDDFERIPKAAEKDFYELSAAQERMYFLYLFDEQSVAYNIPEIRRLETTVDKERLENAFKQLIARHDILRTSFQLIDDRPVQKIAPTVDFKINYYEAATSELEALYAHFIQPFNLAEGPLLRVAIVSTDTEEHYLLLDMHHIITDGVSYDVLFGEFLALYTDKQLTPVPLQYKDYVHWQKSAAQQEKIAQQKTFWLNEFYDELTSLALPIDAARPTEKSHRGAVHAFNLDSETTAQLKALAGESGATLYMLLLACYHILLRKLSTQNDIVIGTPVAGRYHADLEQLIGLLMNTLPLRIRSTGNSRFVDFLAAVKTKIIACFENQIFQYEELVDHLQINRDTSRNPLFDVMFLYENYSEATTVSTERNDKFSTPVSKFDLSLNATEAGAQLLMNFTYSTDLFQKETIAKFASYFKHIIAAIIADPTIKISAIKMLSKSEEQQLLGDFNRTESPYSQEKTVVDLFQEQVQKNPDHLALVYNGKKINYREFDHQTNQLAHYLVDQYDIGTNDLVGLMLPRTEGMIIAMMAILKAGAAYVPFDPFYPEERKAYIVNDAQCKMIFDEGELLQFKKVATEYPSNRLDRRSEAADLIYVIYTSGSTGQPKGVMLEHRNVVSFFNHIDHQLGYEAAMTIAATTNVTFDISVLEILGSLCLGKKIVLFGEEEVDPESFVQKIIEEKVELLQLTPSRLQQVADFLFSASIPTLKHLIIGGEAFPKKLYLDRDQFSHLNIVNVYGPTEATIWSSALSLKNSSRLSIGSPLDNEKIYLLNEAGNLQPIGVPGEICIAGAGIARGYLNRPKLTAAKFVENPFVKGERLYKTGDLGMWLPDGNIVFIGRNDSQVKIRGHRIELGEIDHTILKYTPKMKQVVCVAKEINQVKVIVCYYVASSEIDKEALKAYLQEKLPAYMIPTHFVSLEEMPLNSSGKINRKALPEITGTDLIRKSYVAPKNEVEWALLEIWEEVLSIEKISTVDNFFDIGGNSILIVKLFSKLKSKFTDPPRLAELFSSPTIEMQAKRLNLKTPTSSPVLEINEIEF